MQEKLIQDTKALAETLKTVSGQLETYHDLPVTDERAWFLLIAPLVGAVREQLGQYEEEFIDAAISGETPLDMLSEHLKISISTIYRRATALRRQQQPKEKQTK